MAEVVENFKKFPLALQLILGGAAVFLIGSFLDMWSVGDSNLLDSTPGIIGLASMIVGAVLAYLKKSNLWALVAILLPTGAVLFFFLSGLLESTSADAGIGLWLLTAGGLAASWGAITQIEAN